MALVVRSMQPLTVSGARAWANQLIVLSLSDLPRSDFG
jgi:hypothetical protein